MDTRIELVEEIRQYVYKHGLDATVERYASELASWPGEPTGIWLRVSSGKQDEANQLPDVLKICAERGHRPAKWYVLHDKSASKGEQQQKIDEMLTDMRYGAISVLACWDSDRLERRGGTDLLKTLADVDAAHGLVDSFRQGRLGIKTMGDRISFFVRGEQDREFVEKLKANVQKSYDQIRANGAVGPGGIPWGFRVEGPKLNKKLAPTDLCLKWVPQIYERCIAGESCRTIAVWLDTEGVPPKRGSKWHEGSVRKLIQNRVYAGRRQNEAKTDTVYFVGVAVVTPARWDRANKALSNRPKRGPVNEANRPLLAGLKCARCPDSPMFRIRLNSRSGKPYYYYRCTGRGAQRRGCGNMIPVGTLDRFVRVWTLVVSDKPYELPHWVEGENWESEKSNVTLNMHEAINKGELDKIPGLLAQMQELESRDVIEGYMEYEPTGMTESQHFASLDNAGRREYLRSRHDIRAEKTGKRPGDFRVIIDGVECSRKRFEAADRAYAAKMGRVPA